MPLRLVKHLVGRGLLQEGQAREALYRQASAGGAVDSAALELSLVSEAEVLKALAEVSGLRAVNLADFEPNPQVTPLVPQKIAERWCVVPLSVEGATLHVACGYPVPRRELEEMALLLGKQLELWVATEVRVRDWISRVYGVGLAQRMVELLGQVEAARGTHDDEGAPPSALGPAPGGVAPAAPASTEASAEAMAREMVEQLARSVAAEPLPAHLRPQPAPTSREEQPVSRGRTDMPAPVAPHASANGTRTGPDVRATARAAPWLPPSLQAAIARGEDIRELLEASPAAAPGLLPHSATASPHPPASAVEASAPAAPRAPAKPEPQYLVFPAASPGAPAPAVPPPPATRPEGPLPADVPEWTLAQARAALKEASHDRERLLDVALRFARRTFDYCAFFAVIRGQAMGWEARGALPGAPSLTEVSIPLDVASLFRTVAVTRGSYVGTPQDSLTHGYLEGFGRKAPRAVFLFPVEVRSRLVALFYADSGPKPVSQRRLSEFVLFCQELPGAFQELILYRKRRVEDASLPVEDTTTGTPSPAQGVAGLGWSPFTSLERTALGRAATLPPMTLSQEERPPPDFGPVLRRLTGPDAATRAHAMADLARSPEASAKVLARAFPGPSAWTRMPVTELPEADELGPIPGALSRLGRPAAVALAPLLDSDDGDARYLALLTAGNLPFAELVDGVLRGLFDLEPDISSAARAAAASLKHVPRMEAAMRGLRQELASRDALRRSLAARALGALHDRESIDGLINLTSSDDEMCAQAAADALKEVTRVTFGTDTRRWTMWWAEARSRRRVEWLVASLRHTDLEVRVASVEELARALGDALGYDAGAPPREREAAVRRWEASLVEPQRARRLARL